MEYAIGILTAAEIEDLLVLQQENLKKNLDAETIEKQGFVTFEYTPEMMQIMMRDAPQIVARCTETHQIVGYALSATLESAAKIARLDDCAAYFQSLPILQNKDFYLMGQICVRVGWRGLGIFDALYQGHKANFSSKYDCLVTEIADDNFRSWAAHKRVGFEIIHTYIGSDGVNWLVVALPYSS